MTLQRATVDSKESEFVLGILQTVGRDGSDGKLTQRTLAAELGIALGLANMYLARCIKKGLIKVQKVPPRRFAYYLTPTGFAEKSRLTARYLSISFDFFRGARRDCEVAIRAARAAGMERLVLLGAGELADIAVICATDLGVEIVAIVDAAEERRIRVGMPVVADLAGLEDIHGAVLTDTLATEDTYAAAVETLGIEKVIVPSLLEATLGGYVRRGTPAAQKAGQ